VVAPLASLDLIKAHLKVETDAENDLIGAYLDAVSGDIRTFYTWEGDVPPQVISATLLKVEALYDAEVGDKVEKAAERLLWPFRRWVQATQE